uniref:Uncharacterized protein n=1 Tax=Arundo donax TaxID=35708 RepID=A0A0A9F7A3_ARUDO
MQLQVSAAADAASAFFPPLVLEVGDARVLVVAGAARSWRLRGRRWGYVGSWGEISGNYGELFIGMCFLRALSMLGGKFRS